MKPSKLYECPLTPDLARDILNIPLDPVEVEMVPPRTIGERVRRGKEAIDEANRHLADSPVAKIVATSLMQKLKKRGTPTILVRYDGTVVLRVVYGADQAPAKEKVRTRRDAPMIQTTHPSNLPYIEQLRTEAAELHIDITHLGQQRRAIHEFIEAHKLGMRSGVDEVTVTPLGNDNGSLPRRLGTR